MFSSYGTNINVSLVVVCLVKTYLHISLHGLFCFDVKIRLERRRNLIQKSPPILGFCFQVSLKPLSIYFCIVLRQPAKKTTPKLTSKRTILQRHPHVGNRCANNSLPQCSFNLRAFIFPHHNHSTVLREPGRILRCLSFSVDNVLHQLCNRHILTRRLIKVTGLAPGNGLNWHSARKIVSTTALLIALYSGM